MRFRTLLGALSVGFLASLASAGCGTDDAGPYVPDAQAPDAQPPGASGPFGDAPPVTGKLAVAHLSGPVDVVRDRTGMVHIYATSVLDAMRAEGYQMAADRTAQLELTRRTAEGRMAELFASFDPSFIDSDIVARTIGLRRAAQKTYDALPAGSEMKGIFDAFADGISQFNARLQAGDEALPQAMIGIPVQAFTAWTGADVLAVARLQSEILSYNAEDEILQSAFIATARYRFSKTATDPDPNVQTLLRKRAGLLADLVHFAPIDKTPVMQGFPNESALTNARVTAPALGSRVTQARSSGPTRKEHSSERASTPEAAPSSYRGAKSFVDAHRKFRQLFGDHGLVGSNNWAVAPSHSATGHAMLASDPHLSLSAPSVFYMVHIHVTDASDPTKNIDSSGLGFPGTPGVILGFNQHLAWGATVAFYDVSDTYQETLTSDGTAVMFKQKPVAIEKIHETIAVAGRAPIEYDVLNVPHHGPLIPNIQNHAPAALDPSMPVLSIKWTGAQPSDELEASFGFMRAKSVDDAQKAMRSFAVGAQNWVFADTQGDIFYSSQSLVPKRDKAAFTWNPDTFEGLLPCFILPGDGSAEWTGDFLEEAWIPHVKNPPQGYVSSANNDQVGTTFDNDPSNDKLPNGEPIYLNGFYDVGFREGRIHSRIDAVSRLTPDDMASIQADVRSPMGAELTPKLLEALAHAVEEAQGPSGTHKDLTSVVQSQRYKDAPIAEIRDVLTRWGTEGGYEAAAGVNLDDGSLLTDARETLASKATLIYNAWSLFMVRATFDDELKAMSLADAPFDMRRLLADLLRTDRSLLKTYDSDSKDSALFDVIDTPALETRDERMVTSLLDTLDFLRDNVNSDRAKWRWGTVHTLRFQSLVPLWSSLSIPPPNDPVFPNGFPRHGDSQNIDVAGFSGHPDRVTPKSFSYAAGPTQRFVIDMDPKGPKARNALPGGEIWDNTSPHFRDQAELWRRNQNHPVSFQHDEVEADAESRRQYVPVSPSM